jgi:hypothetical protein
MPKTFFGIDFSGARDAGARTWIASARLNARKIQLLNVFPASSLPAGNIERALTMRALQQFITSEPEGVFGLDFPFSIHASQMAQPSWLDFAQTFQQRFPNADAFYKSNGGAGNELRRQSDSAARTPFAPTNLRIYRQTFYGIRDLLAPLTISQRATVFPMQIPQSGLPVLIEVCPAVTLRRLNLRLNGYKGTTEFARSQRIRIVDGLLKANLVLNHEQMELVIANTGGDALDSVIAAFASAQAWESGALARSYSSVECIEGVVFA